MHQSIFNVYTLINLHVGSILSVTKKWWEIKHLLYQTATNGCLSVRLWLGPQLIIAAISIALVYNVAFGYNTNTGAVKEGGGASESASEWLQLYQNKERLIAKYEFFENTGQKANKIKDSQHLHWWHPSEQIFTMYYSYSYLLRLCIEKTIQMLTGKTVFPYQSSQWRWTILVSFCT